MNATKYTLDQNCIVDLVERRSNATHIEALISSHRTGSIDVAVLAMSVSEKRPGSVYAENYREFQARLDELGIGDLTQLEPIGYWDITFWDKCIWAGKLDEAAQQMEIEIHSVLFPGESKSWRDYAAQFGLGLTDTTSRMHHKWRNHLCDVQAIWSHIHHGRDILVTSDRNFLKSKRDRLIALGARDLRTPADAAAHVVQQ